MSRLADTLAEFPTQPSLDCQTCKAKLLLWPEGRGLDFQCDGGGKKIRNNGKNR